MLPLEGLRVLDLTRARAGPVAARQFADWGADVIMVESPVGSDDFAGGSRDGPDFQNLHRNKRSVVLNLKGLVEKEAFLNLVRSADILLENFRPDVKNRLGIDFETLHRINPRLIYASISGFGQNGPYANRPGFDPIIQAFGGLMSITGEPEGGPMRVGIAISDIAAGLYCAIAVLTAMHQRTQTGLGSWVRTSLLESEIAILDFQAARWLMDGDLPVQEGNNHPTGVPTGMFATADSNIMIAPGGQAMFSRFAQLVGRDDWLTDPRFATNGARYDNRNALRAEITDVLLQRNTDQWVEACLGAGIPSSPVNRIDQVFADPHVQLLGITSKVTLPGGSEIELVSQPIQIGDSPFKIRSPAPGGGEHMEEIFKSIGYSDAQIAELDRAINIPSA